MFSTPSTLLLSLLAITGTLAAPNPLQKRIELSCTDNGGGTRPVSAAQSCVDYLNNKGDDACTITGESGIFCQNGDTVITGSNVSGKGSSSSSCRDVATGVKTIIDRCASDGQVAGYANPNGNGDIIVSINRK
ncbi:hypothetical protein BDW62DRAFT_200943 [Aspergillus aurantiobrunneus]